MGIKTHAALWAASVVLVLFLVGHFLAGPDSARIVINSLVIGMNLAVCLTWFKRAFDAFKAGVRTGRDNIFIGVWLGAFVNILYFLYLVTVIALGRPDWSRTLPIGGLFSVGFFLSAAALLLTPLNTTEVIEAISFRWWLFAVGISMFMAGSLMTLAFTGFVNLNF